jgi:hypothetical protein
VEEIAERDESHQAALVVFDRHVANVLPVHHAGG